MFYLANFEPETGGFNVSFPDIPEALTCGDDFNHAMELAEDALICAIELYFDYDNEFPLSNGYLKGDSQEWVHLPDSVYLKVLVNNARLKAGLTKAQLARLTNLTPIVVQSALTVRRYTKMDTLTHILACLGLRFNISVSESLLKMD